LNSANAGPGEAGVGDLPGATPHRVSEVGDDRVYLETRVIAGFIVTLLLAALVFMFVFP